MSIKITATSIEQFEKIESILKQIDNESFLKKFNSAKSEFRNIELYCDYWYESKLYLPKSFEIKGINFSEYEVLEKVSDEIQEPNIKQYLLNVILKMMKKKYIVVY